MINKDTVTITNVDFAESGLTTEEQWVAQSLIDAWNLFMDFIDPISSDHQERMRQAIHDAQGVLMERVCQRSHPEFWR
jgi:hypothetical protein